MGRSFLLSLVVFFATIVTVYADEGRDFFALQGSARINEDLRLLFPVNIVKKDPDRNPSGANATECLNQVKLLQNGLTKGSIWALKMIDASSKIPAGVLMGNRIDLGMYDECMDINVIEDNEEIRGRHCMYSVTSEVGGVPISQTLSACFPATCEADHVQEIMKSSLEPIGNLSGLNISLSVGYTTCSSIHPPEWTAGEIVTVTGFGILLLFLIVCTAGDIFMRYYIGKPPLNDLLMMLRKFSILSNTERVFSTKSTPGTLPAVPGLRFFSMSWVIMGHSHLMAFSQATVNPVSMLVWVPTWSSLHIIVAPFSVDTFFVISSFLMTYSFLKDMSIGRNVNLFKFYLHRYLRLTPALVAVLLITIFIAPRLGSGALWENGSNFEKEDCKKNSWRMLLYIHNYIKAENQGCLGHTWYLAVEMHYFWLSPLILYPLAKKPKIGLGILAAFFIAAIATPVKIGYDNKWSTAIITGRQFSGSDRFMDKFYFASHVRGAPWFIGIFLGYVIVTYKGSPSKAIKWIGWLMTMAAFSFAVISVRISEREDYTYNIIWESFYTALSRPLWGFAIAWIIYACIHGLGGPVSKFLSFSIYTPLSRISYCAYLAHYQIQFMKARAARTSFYFSTFNAFNNFLSDWVLSLTVGFCLHLIVEVPFMLLDNMLLKRRPTPKNDSNKLQKLEATEKGFDNSGPRFPTPS